VAGIEAGSYTYTRLRLTVELYEGLANQQVRGFTKAMVTCDPQDVLMGGGFRTYTDGAAPILIAASYPSNDAGHMVAPGASPSTWTVIGYSSSGGGKLVAYALCLVSPTTAVVTTSTATGTVAPGQPTSLNLWADCPPGQSLLGGGFLTEQASSLSPPPQISALSPSNGTNQSTTWTVAADPSSAGQSRATVRATALCIAGRSGFTIDTTVLRHDVSSPQPPGSLPVTSQFSCPEGYPLTGGGFWANSYDTTSPFIVTSDVPLMIGSQALWQVGGYIRPDLYGSLLVWTVCLGPAYSSVSH
jgi:hypothetical protein